MLPGTHSLEGIVRQPDLRLALPPPKETAGFRKAEIPVVKALLPTARRQVGPILRYQVQKEPGLGVLRYAVFPDIAQLFAILL